MGRPALSRRSLLSGLGLGAVGLAVGRFAATGSGTTPSWPQYRYDATGAGYAPDRTVPRESPNVRWKHEFDQSGFLTLAPILHDGHLYHAFGDGLVALDAEAGAVAYELTDSDRQFCSTPAVASARAYVTPALVVAWQHGYQALGIDGGLAVPGTDARLFTSRWRLGADSNGSDLFPTLLGGGWQTPPAVADGTVFVQSDELVALDASSGRVRWHGESRAAARPAIADGSVYVPNYETDAALLALDAETGARNWQVWMERPPDRQPVVADGMVFVSNGERVVAVEVASKERTWQRTADENERFVSLPVVRDGTVYCWSRRWTEDGESEGDPAHEGGRLYALDAKSGTERWTAPSPVPDDHHDGPVGAGDVLLLPADDALYAFDADSGKNLWHFEGEYGVSSPVVGDGTVYFADAKSIYALEGQT